MPGRILKFGETFEADELASFGAVRGSNFVDQAHVDTGLGGLGQDFRYGCWSDWCGCGRGWSHGGFPFVSTAKMSSGYRRDVHTLDLCKSLVKRTE